jgi:hypothetical protein
VVSQIARMKEYDPDEAEQAIKGILGRSQLGFEELGVG